MGKLAGLFVDDGRFALAIALWLSAAFLVHHFVPDGTYQGPMLFLGLAALLVWTCLRATRRAAASRTGLVVQPPALLGSRQARSKGRRQA